VADRSKLTAMISSEVQRTLVKSPPELWAEISDPESLARHLGEFGEIRITRVQPEQKVEWEGDRTSGTVVIKPSGWGTKVKLTVTRELVPESDDAPALAGSESPGPALAPDPDALGPHEPPIAPPEVARPDDEPPARQGAPEMGTVPQVERAPQPRSASESVPDRDSTSDAEAAPELDPVRAQSPSAAQTEPSAERDAALATAPASATEPELTDRAERVSEPSGRRGFFARLFGRRPNAAQQPSPVPASDVDRHDSREPLIDEPVAEESDADRPIAETLKAERPAGEQPTRQEPTGEEPTGEEPTGEEPTGEGHIADDLGDADLPADGLTPSEPTTDEPAMFDPAANEPQGELAGELAAAEEVTAEQVQAVLTGVLDRLGAAHHRPFSRG
jgi:hypothetical protein